MMPAPESNQPLDSEALESMLGLAPEANEAGELKSGMKRDKPEVDPSRSALVKQWQKRVQLAKSHWKKDFARMKEDQRFLGGAQWNGIEDEDKYQANIIQRHINQRVAALYAKNPKVVVRKRKTMDFTHWDGTTDSLQSIQMTMQACQQSGMPMPPQVMEMIQDISQGVQRRQMLEKVADNLQII